jgi:lipopolysaccharide export LptBFGC system permease protein LptF
VLGRTLFRYILGEMLRTLLVATVWLMMVGLLALLVRARFSSSGQLLGMRECLMMLPWMLPYLFSVALPPAVLAASCSAFGRLAAENELVAMRAAGLSFVSMAKAPLALGLVCSLALLWLNLEGFRFSAAALARQEAKAQLSPESLCRPGSRMDLEAGGDRLTFSFERPNPDGSRPVSLAWSGRGGGLRLSARDFQCRIRSERDERGQLARFASFTLRDVAVVADPWNPNQRGVFQEYALPEVELPAGISRAIMGSGNMRASLDQNLALAKQLRAELAGRIGRYRDTLLAARRRLAAAAAGAGLGGEAVLELQGLAAERNRTADVVKQLNAVWAEASRKLAFSFSPLVFALLGIGLGAAARKSSKLISLTLGVLAAALYYGAWVAGRAVSQYELMPAEMAPWLPNVLGLLGAGILIRRQNRG